jgi:hypothetical protein
MARTAVIAGTATAASNRVSRRQAGRWAAQDQAAAPPPAAPPPAAAAPVDDGTDRKLDQLRELGELKAQGVLTEEEFAAQKAQILGA